MLEAYTMKRVAAGDHLPKEPCPWLFERAKRPDDRAYHCQDCSFFPSAGTSYWFLHLSGVGRVLWANTGEGSARGAVTANYATLVRSRPNEHSQLNVH